jgi:hypothetical protein
MLAALFIMALFLVPVFAGAQADTTTVSATADKQFVKPGDSLTVSFLLTNVADMYNYQIDLPLGSLVTAANVGTPWVKGNMFEGKTTFDQNVLNGETATIASTLLGNDSVTLATGETRTLGSIALVAGAQDGIYNIPLQNVETQQEAEAAIVFFDDFNGNKILYNAQPLNVIIDGTAPVINLDATPEVVNEEQAGNVVTISGTVQETNLDTVKVNDQLATLNGNGFSYSVSLQDGVNVINVVATDKAGNSSSVVQRNISFIASKPAAPTADPEAGTYAVGVWVRLVTATPGAQIYYTTDDSTPTEESTPYTDKITITSTATIKAIAVKDNKTSNVATFEYAIGPPGPGDDALNQLASELVRLYNNMDANDKAALEAARARINAPGVNWEQLLAPVLGALTQDAKNALGPDPGVNLRNFILDGLNIYYTPNTNADQVAQQLKIFRSTYKPMITGVFDGGVAVEDIWNFILAVQDAVPGQFTEQDLTDLLNKGFDIIEDRLQDWLNGAMDETLNKPEYQVFKNKLAEAGLTRDILIQTKDNLFNAAEPDLSAEQAVVKAYVRSRVELVGKTTLLAGNTETYQLNAMGVNLASLLKWHSSNPGVAEFTQGSTLKAKASGTTSVTAYWDTQDGLNKAWLKKFDVTVQPKTDVTPPTIITATHNAGDGWLKAGNSFKITVLSETNAFAYYKIGDGNWVQMAESQFIKGRYQGTYTVSGQSPNSANVAVEVKVVDQSENETVAGLPAVKIDTVAPNAPGISLGTIDPAAKTAQVTLNTADLDATSGAKAVELYRWSYREQGWVLLQAFGEDAIAQGTITHDVGLREGDNRFGTKAVDKAGNVSGINETTYKLDTKPPVFTIYTERNDGNVTVTVFASEDLRAGPNATYKVVDRATGDVLEQGNIALALVDAGLRKYTGAFSISNTNKQLDITVTGTDLNGLSGTSIYSELPIADIIGKDVQFNDVGLLVPPDAYFEDANQRINVGDDKGEEGANKDLDVVVAKQFRPDGTEFKDQAGNPVYVAITFNYDPIAVPDPNKLIIYYYNPTTGLFEEWSDKVVLGLGETIPDPPVPYRLYIDPYNGRITIYTDHFSVYGVAVDDMPPVLNLTSPADGSKAKGSVTVSGDSENGATITIKLNGTPVEQFILQGASFSKTVSLVANQVNTIEVTAADAVGNSTTRTVAVTEDSTLPTLELVSPTGDTTTTESSIDVRFKTDALDVGVTVAVGGGETQTVEGGGGGAVGGGETQTVEVTQVAEGEFKATVPLDLGANSITITATNDNGPATTTITVTRQQPAPSPGGSGGAAPAPGVGPAGGKVTGPAGKAVVEVPAGALDKKVVITIKQVAPADVTAPPATLKLAGDIYEFGPAGTQFKKPVKITLKYDPAKLGDVSEDNLKVYLFNETTKTWEALGGVVDKVNHTLTVEVNHFSKYAVMFEVAVPQPVLTDIAGHWAKAEIEKLVALGIVNGYPDRTFRPDNNITRAEFTKILVKAMGLAEVHAGVTFSDVSAGLWSHGYIGAAFKAGLVKGYEDGAFRPENKITRQEMAAMLVRAMGKEAEAQAKAGAQLNFKDADTIAAWANGYVAVAVEQGLVKGYPDNTFGPLRNATRAETATMAVRYLDAGKK